VQPAPGQSASFGEAQRARDAYMVRAKVGQRMAHRDDLALHANVLRRSDQPSSRDTEGTNPLAGAGFASLAKPLYL
jgi:hypothetical protein